MIDDLYLEHIIDHYRNPRNFGELPNADVVVQEANATCGDSIQLALEWTTDFVKSSRSTRTRRSRDRKGGVLRIQNVRFKGAGCAISVAAASLLTERIDSRKWTIEKLKKLTDQDMLELLGVKLSAMRLRCATLPLRALEKALRQKLP